MQASKYEVFVTQPPEQDPQTCFQRNVHGRTAQDVLDASRSLEPSPPAICQLNCSGIIPKSVPETDSEKPPLPSDVTIEDSPRNTNTKRKSADVPGASGGEEKRSRIGDAQGVIDDSAVLAMVDAGFSERGVSPGTAGGPGNPRSKRTGRGGRMMTTQRRRVVHGGRCALLRTVSNSAEELQERQMQSVRAPFPVDALILSVPCVAPLLERIYAKFNEFSARCFSNTVVCCVVAALSRSKGQNLVV